MTIFEQTAATMLSICGYVRDTISGSLTATQLAITSFQVNLRMKAENTKKTTKFKSASSLCRQMTTAGINEFREQYQFTKILDVVLQRDDAIILHDTATRTYERNIHEYLAAAQLLNVDFHKEHMSLMLYDIIHTITQSHCPQNITERLLAEEGLLRSIDSACILVEHVLFNRCRSIDKAIDRRLVGCVYINEMLQLLFMLHKMTQTVSDSRIVAWHTIDTAHLSYDDEDGGMSVNIIHRIKRLKSTRACHKLFHTATRLINVQTILPLYSQNTWQLMTINSDVCKHGAYINDYMCLHSEINYDVLLATQIFISFALRRGLYYEMQRNFNAIRDAQVNLILTNSENVLTQRHTSLAMLLDTLMQLRLAHAVSIYYMHGILKLFIDSTIRFSSAQIEEKLMFRTDAHTCILLLQSLNVTTAQMAKKFVEYVYASALNIINTYDTQAHKALLLNEQQMLQIANDAVKYMFNELAHQCALSCVDRSYDRQALTNIITTLSPLNDNGNAQLAQYLQKQVIQILNNLQNNGFVQFRNNMKHLLHKGFNAAEHVLILHKQQTNSSILNIFKQIAQDKNMRILTEALIIQDIYGCKAYEFFALTEHIMHKIRRHRFNTVVLYGVYTLATISVAFAINHIF